MEEEVDEEEKEDNYYVMENAEEADNVEDEEEDVNVPNASSDESTEVTLATNDDTIPTPEPEPPKHETLAPFKLVNETLSEFIARNALNPAPCPKPPYWKP